MTFRHAYAHQGAQSRKYIGCTMNLLLLSTCRFSTVVTRIAFSFVFCSTRVRRKALSDLVAVWAFSIALNCSKMAEDIGGSVPGLPDQEAFSAWIISDDMLLREPYDLLWFEWSFLSARSRDLRAIAGSLSLVWSVLFSK